MKSKGINYLGHHIENLKPDELQHYIEEFTDNYLNGIYADLFYEYLRYSLSQESKIEIVKTLLSKNKEEIKLLVQKYKNYFDSKIEGINIHDILKYLKEALIIIEEDNPKKAKREYNLFRRLIKNNPILEFKLKVFFKECNEGKFSNYELNRLLKTMENTIYFQKNLKGMIQYILYSRKPEIYVFFILSISLYLVFTHGVNTPANPEIFEQQKINIATFISAVISVLYGGIRSAMSGGYMTPNLRQVNQQKLDDKKSELRGSLYRILSEFGEHAKKFDSEDNINPELVENISEEPAANFDIDPNKLYREQ